jgi:hypothetical protein
VEELSQIRKVCGFSNIDDRSYNNQENIMNFTDDFHESATEQISKIKFDEEGQKKVIY